MISDREAVLLGKYQPLVRVVRCCPPDTNSPCTREQDKTGLVGRLVEKLNDQYGNRYRIRIKKIYWLVYQVELVRK